ncbi:MAG TPA: hypothetical protein VFM01_14135, partial [Nakamurella sp.]|nr:hypothetical protein [Nakamurella sp.]
MTMARQLFGASPADYVVAVGADNLVVFAPGATLTAWNAATGGTQYTDITQDQAGTLPVTTWLAGDGTGSTQVGRPAQVYGPDGVLSWWVDAGSGSRVLMMCSDLAALVSLLASALATTTSNLTSHLQAVNPHATKSTDLADFKGTPTPADGQVLVWDIALGGLRWANAPTGGSGGGVSLTGGSTIQIANGDTVTMALRILLPAGDRTTAGAPNTLSVQWNAGTDSAPNWQETFRLNEYGELRLQPSAANRVAARIKQYNGSQTSNLTEWTDFSNNVLASVAANGAVRGPNSGMILPYSLTGTVATGTGKHRLYNDTGVPLIIRAVRASVGTAPTGSSLIVDVNKGGTSIFSTQSNRPTIPAGANTSGKVTAINTTSLADGEYLTVDVDAVGS